MWGREMRAGLVFVLAALLVGGGYREWRRSHESRFQDLIAELDARDAIRAHRMPAAAAAPADSPRTVSRAPRALEPGLGVGGIDPDEASGAELERLPGIGPSLASRIVADRALHGPYRSPEALMRVSGIGPRILDRIRSHLIFRAPTQRDSLNKF